MARASIAPPPDPAPKVWKPKVPALARWVQLELVCGPYKKDELPWVSVRGGELFLDAKIAPVSIVIKENGMNG